MDKGNKLDFSGQHIYVGMGAIGDVLQNINSQFETAPYGVHGIKSLILTFSIKNSANIYQYWIPAFAGMTSGNRYEKRVRSFL